MTDQPVRIGDRVRCLVGDYFLDAGTEGLVTNTRTAMGASPGVAYVTWDNDTKTRIRITDLEVIEPRNKPQQPTVMMPFGRAS